ncbi:hypothetical protein BDD12DRAFT_938380 [Trichophaea hybrida]|nr:hypothetical protein BDD12DRAFT_938380 [Trichophaea hybrida]
MPLPMASLLAHNQIMVHRSSNGALPVKQVIGEQGIVPFHRLIQWKTDRGSNSTPAGGLLIHWIFSTLMVSVTPYTEDGYAFITSLFTYGHTIVGMVIAAGILWFPESRRGPRKFLKSLWILVPFAVFFCLINLFIIIGTIIKSGRPIPRAYQLAGVSGVFFLGFLWWVVIKLLGTRLGRILGIIIITRYQEPQGNRRFAKGQAQKIEFMVRRAHELLKKLNLTERQVEGPAKVLLDSFTNITHSNRTNILHKSSKTTPLQMSDARILIPQAIQGRYLKLNILKNWLEDHFGPNKATAKVPEKLTDVWFIQLSPVNQYFPTGKVDWLLGGNLSDQRKVPRGAQGSSNRQPK